MNLVVLPNRAVRNLTTDMILEFQVQTPILKDQIEIIVLPMRKLVMVAALIPPVLFQLVVRNIKNFIPTILAVAPKIMFAVVSIIALTASQIYASNVGIMGQSVLQQENVYLAQLKKTLVLKTPWKNSY